MPEMIPDRLPQRASTGEKKLFSILQKLSDDYIVYYEPIVENRYPDFIIICPDLGLIVIEVKGWYPKDIKAGDLNNILIKTPRQKGQYKHPIRQARDYMLSLMDQCREYPESQRLLHKTGDFHGKFTFPFGYFSILSNITSEQLKNHTSGDLTSIFPPNKVVTRDILETWESMTTEQLCETISSFFDPFWKIERLTEGQINTIRAIIHPEIVLSKPEPIPDGVINTEDTSLKVLDLKQENNARNIGGGHRIIYGVAGSGKTVLLIAKAKLLSAENSDNKILFLCYNVALASYLRAILSNYSNIKVQHFDAWAKANYYGRKNNENNKDLGRRFLNGLEDGCPDSRYYDAVMIDEAQDFDPSWFKCVLESMKEPNDGDLIIVGDGSQGLYSNSKISWKSIGINAQGRTLSKKFDLDKNYRNSREIVELAAIFAEKGENNEDGIIALEVDPNICLRSTGMKPTLVMADNRRTECTKVVYLVKNLIDGKLFGQEIQPLEPQEIGIFYPLASGQDRGLLSELINQLSEFAPATWLNRDQESRRLVSEKSIKLQTIHSAKGLQYRAVIMMWSDILPKDWGECDEQAERRLFYVGLTRAEDFLIITASGSSKFITEIEQSGKVDFA